MASISSSCNYFKGAEIRIISFHLGSSRCPSTFALSVRSFPSSPHPSCHLFLTPPSCEKKCNHFASLLNHTALSSFCGSFARRNIINSHPFLALLLLFLFSPTSLGSFRKCKKKKKKSLVKTSFSPAGSFPSLQFSSTGKACHLLFHHHSFAPPRHSSS